MKASAVRRKTKIEMEAFKQAKADEGNILADL